MKAGGKTANSTAKVSTEKMVKPDMESGKTEKELNGLTRTSELNFYYNWFRLYYKLADLDRSSDL
jgi:hypothetical protein